MLALSGLWTGCTKDTSAGTRNPPTAPDNSGTNARDRNDRTLTPMDQGTSSADVDLTARVRKALVADDTLSTNAKNVKVITLNGTVTLRGPVKTDAERTAVVEKAQAAAGAQKVVDELEVTGR